MFVAFDVTHSTASTITHRRPQIKISLRQNIPSKPANLAALPPWLVCGTTLAIATTNMITIIIVISSLLPRPLPQLPAPFPANNVRAQLCGSLPSWSRLMRAGRANARTGESLWPRGNSIAGQRAMNGTISAARLSENSALLRRLAVSRTRLGALGCPRAFNKSN